MRKGSGRPIVVLDKYTRKEIARYPTIQEGAKDLELKENSVRVALSLRTPIFDCYFVYQEKLEDWEPRKRCWSCVRGNKESQKINELKTKALC